MLVVRPQPQPTESLMGYVLRLTEANGYSTTSYLLASMHGYWYRSAIGRLEAEPLIDLAGISQDDVARLTLRPEEKPRAYIRLFGNDLPSYEVTLRSPKVCPLCLTENGCCEAFWDLAQAVACPVHQVMLISRCPQCQSDLRWSRPKLRECRCGLDLARWPTQPATSALCDLMGVMRHLIYKDAVIAPLPESMQHLAHLDLRKFCKLAWVMSGALHQRQGGESLPKARTKYLPQLERIATALSKWPASFQEFLSETYESELVAAKHLPNFRMMFNWLLTRLIKNDDGDGAAYSFLEAQTYEFGAKFWTRNAMSRGEGADNLMPVSTRWGTISEGAEILGLHMATMKKLVESGEIKTRTISGKSMQNMVVDLDWARSQKQSRHPPLSVRIAARQVGVSIETLKAMKAKGVYLSTHRSRFPGSLSSEDVDALDSLLRGLTEGKGFVRGNHVLTVERAFVKWSATPDEKAAVLAHFIENPNCVIGCKASGVGISRMQVSSAVMENYLCTLRPDNLAVGLQEAARRLNCTAAVITALRRTGSLGCQPSKGRDAICESSLIEFEQKYEVMSSVAARSGISCKRAYARADISKVHHLKVDTSQYSTVFFCRNDIKRAEKLLRSAR